MKTEAESWQCPYCNGYATIGEEDKYICEEQIKIIEDTDVFFELIAIQCPNSSCGKLNLTLSLEDRHQVTKVESNFDNSIKLDTRKITRINHYWQLLPNSRAKIFPDYIPKFILDDYNEASLIALLSPKASATLSRRCLQAIIRDFWQVKDKKTLYEEIETIIQRGDIPADVTSTLHDLRQIGNIGAHMNKDSNLIIDIDQDEAAVLVQYIEYLIELTYVQKNERDKLLKKIKEIGETKRPRNTE